MTTAPGTAPRQRAALLGALAVLGAIVCWTLVELVAGTIPSRYSAYQTVWVRYTTHLVCLTAYLTVSGEWRLLRTRRPALHLLRGSMMLLMPVAFLLTAPRLGTEQLWAVFWSAPLFTLPLAARWLGERVERRHWVAAVAIYLAALLALRPAALVGPGLLVGLPMTATLVVYVLLTRHLAAEGVVRALLSTSITVCVGLAPVAAQVWVRPDLATAGAMLVVGLLGFLFLLALDAALHFLPVVIVTPLLTAEPVFSLVVHRGLAGHGPGRGGLLAAGLAIAAAAAILRARRLSPRILAA